MASRTFSRKQFEVLGLGLEDQVLGLGLKVLENAYLRLRTALFFDLLKLGQGHEQLCFVLEHTTEHENKIFEELFFGERLIFVENLRIS